MKWHKFIAAFLCFVLVAGAVVGACAKPGDDIFFVLIAVALGTIAFTGAVLTRGPHNMRALLCYLCSLIGGLIVGPICASSHGVEVAQIAIFALGGWIVGLLIAPRQSYGQQDQQPDDDPASG